MAGSSSELVEAAQHSSAQICEKDESAVTLAQDRADDVAESPFIQLRERVVSSIRDVFIQLLALPYG